MKLPTLYKNSKRGATQQWTIEVENNKYRTIAGQVGGKLTVTEWTTCKGLNVGKSNATTDNEQALKDAQSNWQYKIDRANYATSIEGIAQVKFKEPMLAKNYKDRKDNINFNPLILRYALWGCKVVFVIYASLISSIFDGKFSDGILSNSS